MPEIIFCKDCKKHDRTDCGMKFKTVDYDFCSRAERKEIPQEVTKDYEVNYGMDKMNIMREMLKILRHIEDVLIPPEVE